MHRKNVRDARIPFREIREKEEAAETLREPRVY